MIVTASVPFQCPRAVDAVCQHLKGFMPYPGRTGPCGGARGDQEQGEACQTNGGCTGQRQRSARSGGAKGGFRTEMSYGWRPSAHGGSGSQGAPSASCRHVDFPEMSQWKDDKRVGVRGREGWECHSPQILWMPPKSPPWDGSRPFYSDEALRFSPPSSSALF